ncbi:MAG: hypothetical protein R3F19_27005 [Verrucomicrobiales bacterium]
MTIENEALRSEIARSLVPDLTLEGFGSCPGKHLHGTRNGARDFQVKLDGAPTASCFHGSCIAFVEELNHELRRRIAIAESDGRKERPTLGSVAPEPRARHRAKRPAFDPAKLSKFAARCPHKITQEWLLERSPRGLMDEQGTETSELFLSELFVQGERMLVFTSQTSQGDFLYESGRGNFRLGKDPGVLPVPSALPTGSSEGVWFLSNPVTGSWLPNPNKKLPDGSEALGRRHGACITAWRHLVLESDDANESDWLACLVQLPVKIVAIYTSGGRSVHALVRLDAASKSHWDAMRDTLAHVVCALGADPAAMTAVRLSRLPGALRHGSRGKDGRLRTYPEPRMQRLLWLNPLATDTPIIESV